MRGSVLVFCILIAIGADAFPDPSPTPSHITSRIRRQPVQSSVIANVGYSKRRHILEIEFRDLMSAESKARFYDSNIRKHYRSALVRQRQKQEAAGNSRAAAQDHGAAAQE